MKKYLYLEPDEDNDSILKKIKKHKEKTVNLVIPANAKVFSKKNINELKKKTDQLKKEICIHSNDENGMEIAEKAGYKIEGKKPEATTTIEKKTEEAAPRVDSNNKSRAIKIVYKKTPSTKIEKPKVKKVQTVSKTTTSTETKEPSTLSQIIFGAISIISIAIIALVILYVLPKTDIAITTQSNKIPLDTNITFNTGQSNVDYINNIVPAQIINIDEEIVHEERATGEINDGEKARGTITVYNKSSAALPLVGNTRFITSGGILFRSTGSVNVPAGGSANVSVLADQIGEDGNIGPSHFTLPALAGSESIIYGESSSAMTGGTNNITYVISEADLEFTTDEIKDKLFEKALADIDEKLPNDRKYISPDINDIEIITEFSNKVGDQVDTFNITAKTTYPFIVYEESDLQELVNQNLAKLISQDRSVVSGDQDEYTLRIISADFGSGNVVANITTQAITTPTYNTDIMKNELAGMTREEVKAYFLQYPEIQQIDITFWPDWVKRVSKIPSRINIEIVWN